MSEAEKMTHARKLNMARRHLTREQRNDLIRQQLRETPEKSDRKIAADLGVNHETVGRQRSRLEATGGIRQLDKRTGADGKNWRQVRKFRTSDRHGAGAFKVPVSAFFRVRRKGITPIGELKTAYRRAF